MIKLSNGHKFDYLAASGSLAYDGLGWWWEWFLSWLGFLDPTLFTVVVKTLTRHPRKGNLRMWWPWGCIRLIWRGLIVDGVVNAVGLTNPGIEWWCKTEWPKIKESKVKVRLIVSIFGEPDELVEMVKMLNELDDPDGIIVGVQINGACPNSGEDLKKNADKVIRSCKLAKEVSRHPLLLSLSVAQDWERIVPRVKGVIECFTINSVPWYRMFGASKSPLAHLGGGGVSGRIVQPITWGFAMDLEQLTDIPVAWPSVWDYRDIHQMRSLGRSPAISFGSVFLRYPWRPTMFVRRDMRTVRHS